MKRLGIAGIALSCAVSSWMSSRALGREAAPDPQAVVARAIERTKRDVDEARRRLIARREKIAN